MFKQLLMNLGYTQSTQKRTNGVYISPFNPSEKTPSFFLIKSNTWNGQDALKEYNFSCKSTSKGGDIYKFVQLYFNLNFQQSKVKIAEILGLNYQEPTRQILHAPIAPTSQPKKNYNITRTQPLQNTILLKYLAEKRGITNPNALKYISEVYYTLEGKSYFAISFYNDVGGMEIRNEFFKASFNKKSTSTIRPYKNQKNLKWFEGFMDFLSYIQGHGTLPKSDYIILNSLSLLDTALGAIEYNYDTHELYFDNDNAGDNATNKIIEFFGNQGVTDKRVIYKNYKDLNNYLISA